MKIRIIIALIALCIHTIYTQDDIVITPMPETLQTKTIIPAPKSNSLELALTHTPPSKENYNNTNLDKLAKLLGLPPKALNGLTKTEVEKQIREKFIRPNITKIQTALDSDSDIVKQKTEIDNLFTKIFGARSSGVENSDEEKKINTVIENFKIQQFALFRNKYAPDPQLATEVNVLLQEVRNELKKYTVVKNGAINNQDKLNYLLTNIYNTERTAHLFNEIMEAKNSKDLQFLQKEIPYLLESLEDEKKVTQKYYKDIEPLLKESGNIGYAGLLLDGVINAKLYSLDAVFLPNIEAIKRIWGAKISPVQPIPTVTQPSSVQPKPAAIPISTTTQPSSDAEQLNQIQKNIQYIFSNLADADSGEFVSKEAAKAINEAAQALVKVAGSDTALKNVAMNVATITSNSLKDIKIIDEAMPKYLGKKGSLKRKFLNLFKKEEEKQPLVSSKDKNKAGRTIMDARESLAKQSFALLAERNKAAGMQTKQVAQLIMQLCNKLEELANSVVKDEDVKGANDKN